MATKLEKLLQKEAQLKAQIQQAKAAERTLEKKRDTRRKILIGAAVMARVERGEWPEADLLRMMDGFLSRPNERALFDLDEAAEAVEADEEAEASSKGAAGSVGRSKNAAAALFEMHRSDGGSGRKTGRKRRLSEPALDVDDEFDL